MNSEDNEPEDLMPKPPKETSDWDDIEALAEDAGEGKTLEDVGEDNPEIYKVGWGELTEGIMDDEDSAPVFRFLIVLVVFLLALLVLVSGFWTWLYFSEGDVANSIRGWATTYWPLLAFFVLQGSFIGFAGGVFRRLQTKLDHKYPDDMDVHSGHWLQARLKELGMSNEVRVSGITEEYFRGADIYDPRRDIVFLADVTYHKNDPTFWAIAAHELGHALVHRKHKIWSAVTHLARFLLRNLMMLIPISIVMASLYGSELINGVVYGLLVAGVFVGSLVVADEAWATLHALKVMRDDDRIHDETLKDIGLLLGAALSTYAAPLVLFCVVLLFWGPFNEFLLSADYVVGVPLEGSSKLLAGIISLVLVGFLVRVIWHAFRPDEALGVFDPSRLMNLIPYIFATIFLQIAFFQMTWNLGGSDVFMVASFLFATRFAGIAYILLSPFTMFLSLLGGIALKGIFGAAPEVSTEVDAADTKKMPRATLLDPNAVTTWSRLFTNWTWINALPLICVWWISIL